MRARSRSPESRTPFVTNVDDRATESSASRFLMEPTKPSGNGSTHNSAFVSARKSFSCQSSTIIIRGFKGEKCEERIREAFAKFNLTEVSDSGNGVFTLEFASNEDGNNALTWLRSTCFNNIKGTRVFGQYSQPGAIANIKSFSEEAGKQVLLAWDFQKSAPADLPTGNLVATYQWTGRGGMLIPGSPPTVRSPVRNVKEINPLPEDSNCFINENNFWRPVRPTEPIFDAIRELDPGFNWNDIDIVTDRNNLRKLISFLQGEKKDFRIYMDLAQQTGHKLCVLTRVEPRDRDEEARGYAHSFEHALTEPNQGSGFYRILKLNLGGLNIVVRTETDAVEPVAKNIGSDAEDDDEKYDSMDANRFCQGIRRAGSWSRIRCQAGAEMKTKNAWFKKDFEWERVFIQMLLGNVQQLYVGWMEKCGYVQSIDTYTLQQLKSRISHLNPLFGNLAALLKRIQAHARSKQGSFEIRYQASSSELIIAPTDTMHV